MNFYKRFIGDYAADTRHLTVTEHGAYTLLLDFYYATERPLPLDILKFMSPRSAEETSAFRSALKQFFTRTKRGYSHTRCAKEIKNYKVKIAAYRVSGSKGGSKRQAIARQSLSGKDEFRLENQNQIQNQISQSQKPPASPACALKVRSESDQRRIVEARDTRLWKEAEFRREVSVGRGPECSAEFRQHLAALGKAKAL